MIIMIMIFTISWFLNENQDDENGVFTKGLGERLDAANVVVPTLQVNIMLSIDWLNYLWALRVYSVSLEIFTQPQPTICVKLSFLFFLVSFAPPGKWQTHQPGVSLAGGREGPQSVVELWCSWAKLCEVSTLMASNYRNKYGNTQIHKYANTQEVHFHTFRHFQGWRLQDQLPAGVSTCFAGFGTRSSPDDVFWIELKCSLQESFWPFDKLQRHSPESLSCKKLLVCFHLGLCQVEWGGKASALRAEGILFRVRFLLILAWSGLASFGLVKSGPVWFSFFFLWILGWLGLLLCMCSLTKVSL